MTHWKSVVVSTALVVSCAAPNPEGRFTASLEPVARPQPMPAHAELELAAAETGWSSVPSGMAAAPVPVTSFVDLYWGLRKLHDEDLWDDEEIDAQGVLGVSFSMERPESVVGFETGLLYSQREESSSSGGMNVDAKAQLFELYAGVRKTFGPADRWPVRPYVGAGVSFLNVDVDVDVSGVGSADDDDTTVGGYTHGGAVWQINPRLRLGADLRAVFATDIELFGIDGDANYVQYSMFFGFGI